MSDPENPNSQSDHDLVLFSADVSSHKDIDPLDFRTLIEMYAFKYTRGVVVKEGYEYVTAEHVNRLTGDECSITAPLDLRSKAIPLQMTFEMRTKRRFSRYYLYPGQEVETDSRRDRTEDAKPEEDWLRDLEDFFGPLGIGVGMENYYETEGYRTSQSGDIFMNSGGSDFGYGFGKSFMKAPQVYKGYKHLVYKKLFELQDKSSGRRRTEPIDHTFKLRARDIAKVYLESFPEIPHEAIESVITLVLQSRDQQITDRTIFYALARQYHPDTQANADSIMNEIMKLLNAMYDTRQKRFAF